MRKTGGLALIIGLLMAVQSLAQSSNAWINHSQTYYKIPVAQDGIYRLSYNDLQSAGVPIGTVDPRRINIFHRGVEQAIFVQGQADATFDPADFIEFYGQRNDGTLDADLYLSPSLQPHSWYNLYNDTTAYFLTWNPLPVLGKRMTTFAEANSGLPTETNHRNDQLRVYAEEYAGGLTVSGEIQGTAFDQGEGWTSRVICNGFSGCTGQRDFLIDQLGGAVGAGSSTLGIVLVGRGEPSHTVEVWAGPDAGSSRLLTTQVLVGFESVPLTLTLNQSDFDPSGKINVRVRLLPGASSDQVSVSAIRVTRPQDFNLNSATEKKLNLNVQPINKSYIETSNAQAGTRLWDITDPSAVVMIGTNSLGSGFSAVVNGTSVPRKLWAASATRTSTLKAVTFRLINPAAHNYLIISHRSLMKPALGYSNAVDAYAAYRASAAGGAYDTLTIAMDQLYNQFNYGETSPRAIYEFMKFMLNGGDPQFLFLIGKGLEVSQGYYRKTSFTSADFHDLVPTAGMPASDMAFTAGLQGTTFEPAVATGRLTATTPTQVAAYLNKVKEDDALPFEELWRKDILHLSGGIHPGEPAVFRQYVDGFKAIAEADYLGGSVNTISKQTLNVELVNVKDQVNKGLNLITFYGHSGPGTIDIDIGYVSDPTMGYNNPGKYPGFLINGCNAGRFFDNRLTFGEDWVLTANKGAKAFIAHSYFGFANTLKQYSDIFYSVAFADSSFLRKSIGEVQKETARRYLIIAPTGLINTTQVQQMVLLGDPAVKLFGARKPDYIINNSSLSVVSMDGKPITASTREFALDIKLSNPGRTEPGMVAVRVKRTLSDNSVVQYDSLYDAVRYGATLRMIIRRGTSSAEAGTTQFQVTIDPDHAIAEINEGNNSATISYFIARNGTQNLFPANFGIVSTAGVNLKFQSSDLQSAQRMYRIEVDTAATFDSPFLLRRTISGKVLLEQAVTLLPVDSLVYYWRTRFDQPQGDESTSWTTSSFTFIYQGPTGWAQVQFPQRTSNSFDGLKGDSLLQRYVFEPVVTSVDVTTYGSANSASYTQVSLKINQEEFNVSSQGQPCRNNTLNLIAFDKNTAAPYAGITFNFSDPRSCGREPQMINSYAQNELDLTDGIGTWVSAVHTSDSVILFSIGNAGYAAWSTTTKFQLSQLGISDTQLSSLQPGEPFVIFGRKGAAPGSAQVFRPSTAPVNAQQLDVQGTVTGRRSEGSMSTPLIGPAISWNNIKLQLTEVTGNDVYSFKVNGVDLAGNSTTLKTLATGTHTITDIDALAYPFLQVDFEAMDDIDLNPAQLEKMIISFTPAAEGILLPADATPVTRQEGEPWQASAAFVNLSGQTFPDSLTVITELISTNGQPKKQNAFRILPPPPGDTTKFVLKSGTRGMRGIYDLTVFVNPHVLPEVYYENNVHSTYGYLKVIADETAPLLDVTIDGRYVRNGDQVAASPHILAKLIDDNPFLLKTDTAGVNIFLQAPCSSEPCSFQRIGFTDPQLTWTPASDNSDFTIDFRPQELTTGVYRLRVEGEDASGNLSGTTPYEVMFVVGDTPDVQLGSVYPNPTTDFLNFEFIVSGPESPGAVQFDLFTSQGQLIRSLGTELLSSVHVGTNVLRLPAADASGNPLPAGLYLFRIRIGLTDKEYVTAGRVVIVR